MVSVLKDYGKFFRATAFLSVLLISIAFSSLTYTATAQSDDVNVTIERNDDWMIFQSDVITIMFPAHGRYPMFLWWYTKQNDTVYAVHYKGLIEYYIPKIGERFTRKRIATAMNLVTSFFQEKRVVIQHQVRRFEGLKIRLRNISDISVQLGEAINEAAKNRVDRAINLVENLKEKAFLFLGA